MKKLEKLEKLTINTKSKSIVYLLLYFFFFFFSLSNLKVSFFVFFSFLMGKGVTNSLNKNIKKYLLADGGSKKAHSNFHHC